MAKDLIDKFKKRFSHEEEVSEDFKENKKHLFEVHINGEKCLVPEFIAINLKEAEIEILKAKK